MLDADLIARELLVAFRGRRSQVQWSRRLGYKSNVVYAWESGRRQPTAAETLRAARRTGIDLTTVFCDFYGERPDWIDEVDPATPEGVAAFLDDIRASMTVTELARRADLSRYSVSRWLSAATQPRLPDFLRVVEAASLRLVDLLAALVPPEQLPSVRAHWETLEARRLGAYALPWTQAVLRAVELRDYLRLPAHRPGWIAERLGISQEEEARCLSQLEESGQLKWDGKRFVQAGLAVDTRRSPDLGQRLKVHWSEVGTERIRKGAPGQFSYNVFTVSRKDFERIRELHLEYYFAMRAVVADSSPGQCVAVVNVQLFALDDR